ncbi:STAS/SEC14 domain-containing protein [Nodosilinea nodulosa]|uniref:STAS/SEC14 domain-containing protein n=1 Tax=Nodosilinea nodulosa TaxID=416001 RepID=UPI0002DD45C4|nr:STAS/SEC14 domain-containing protein [Nodosilinea nodulosa]
MIELIPGLPNHILAMTAHGQVTGEDYETVLIPAVEARLKQHEKIRLLYQLGADFTAFNIEAMWDDAKVGLQHLTAWEKIAVVTDQDWIRAATKVFGFALPCPVKVFTNAQLAEAKIWIQQ